MLPSFKTLAISAITSASLALSAAAPAYAWGEREQDFLRGVAATVVIGSILKNSANPRPAPVPTPAPVYEPRHGHGWGGHHGGGYHAPAVSAYDTVSATFRSYSRAERRAIQSTLRAYGYYRGGVDGSFGPATYRAIVAFARDTGGERQLRSQAGAYSVLDEILYS